MLHMRKTLKLRRSNVCLAGSPTPVFIRDIRKRQVDIALKYEYHQNGNGTGTNTPGHTFTNRLLLTINLILSFMIAVNRTVGHSHTSVRCAYT